MKKPPIIVFNVALFTALTLISVIGVPYWALTYGFNTFEIVTTIVLFFFIWAWKGTIDYGLSISISLFVVIIVAGIIGTFIPLFLDKRGVEPAIATGPFITTSNDIFGILIYLWIAKMILGI